MNNYVISVNEIFQNISDETKYRVLWISIDYKVLFWININVKRKMPIEVSVEELQSLILEGKIVPSSKQFKSFRSEETIPESEREHRDKIWKQLGNLLSESNEPDIFFKKTRAKLINQTSNKSGISKNQIYLYIIRYWQRGKTKNAFLPDYEACGGRGKSRDKGKQKLGRPPKYGEYTGIFIDENAKKFFSKIIKKHYHKQKKYSFKATYELLLKEFYSKKIKCPDGTTKLELFPIDKIPTITQFRYWYSKNKNQVEEIKSRNGISKFNLQSRAITGKSDYGIMGPGAKYQIDATIGDVYLVSQIDRKCIIGRPVIYFVIDVFSRVVVGMYVGLEGPSWTGARMALQNAATEKISFCSEYKITINEKEWPCHHLPIAILADRGEMKGKAVENLINMLNIRIENAPSYRADLKGIIEQYFRTINTNVTAFLPGHVKPDMSERGGKDYRLDAKLDIVQLTKIIIKCVIYYNNSHYMNYYELDNRMIEDCITPIPIKLWKWGISNYSGMLRSYPKDIIRMALMPSGNATATSKGIKFKGIYYICDRAIKEQWMEKARIRKSFKLEVYYDPRDMSNIYIKNNEESQFEVCRLLNWEGKYERKCLDEIIYHQESKKNEQKLYETKEIESRINLKHNIDNVINEVNKSVPSVEDKKSKNDRVSGIRENRKLEKELLRKKETFKFNEEQNIKETNNIQNNDAKEITPTLLMIKKKLDERLKNERNK